MFLDSSSDEDMELSPLDHLHSSLQSLVTMATQGQHKHTGRPDKCYATCIICLIIAMMMAAFLSLWPHHFIWSGVGHKLLICPCQSFWPSVVQNSKLWTCFTNYLYYLSACELGLNSPGFFYAGNFKLKVTHWGEESILCSA